MPKCKTDKGGAFMGEGGKTKSPKKPGKAPVKKGGTKKK